LVKRLAKRSASIAKKAQKRAFFARLPLPQKREKA
jgi:hypothetical protein